MAKRSPVARETAAQRAKRHDRDHEVIAKAARRAGNASLKLGRKLFDEEPTQSQIIKGATDKIFAVGRCMAQSIDGSKERVDIWTRHAPEVITLLEKEGFVLTRR